MKYTVSFSTSSSTQVGASYPLRCYIAYIPYGQSLPTASTAAGVKNLEDYIIGNPRYCAHRTLQSEGNTPNLVTVSKYFKIANLMGNPLEYKASSSWNQPITASGPSAQPVNLTGVNIGVNVLDYTTAPAANSYVTVDVRATFYVKFWGLRMELS